MDTRDGVGRRPGTIPDVRDVLPSHEDPLVRGVSTAIGGPVGRHARIGERRFWTALRVLALLAVVMGVLAWGEKATCRTHPYANSYQYTRLCYTDVFVLYGTEGLAQGQVPYLDHKVEYPVLIGAAMYGVAQLDRAFPTGARQREFFDLTAVLLGAALVATVVLTARTHRHRPWDAALVALAPVVILNGDVNWDLLAVAFTAAGVYAWSRGSPGWAGVWIGLGVATKFYPLIVLGALLLLCLRSGRLAAFGKAALGAAWAWLLVDLPVMVASPSGWGYFFSFSERRNTEFNSLWYALDYAANSGRLISTAVLNDVTAVALLLGFAAVALLVLLAPRRPRLPSVVFLLLVLFVITSKVYSPQYVLWLLPFAVLARPRWRFFLAWQLTEVVEFIVLYGYLVYYGTNGAKGASYPALFFMGIAPRDIVLLALAGVVAWEALHPERDVVRADGVDDPAGGVLDGAADAGWVRHWHTKRSRPAVQR